MGAYTKQIPKMNTTQKRTMSSLQDTAGYSGSAARGSPGVVRDEGHELLTSGDYYSHLADLRSHLDADRRMTEQYARPETWAHTPS
jgi:hypothetical protein